MGRLWYVIFVLLFLGVVYGIIFFIGFSLFTYLAVVAAIVGAIYELAKYFIDRAKNKQEGKDTHSYNKWMNLDDFCLETI